VNDYETRQEARRERMRNKAARLRAEAERRHATSDDLGRVMQGQPILVGHHSEKRHRRDIEKMHTNTRKAIEATDEAKRLEAAAARVGSGGISSDDPGAVAKLQAGLATMERQRDQAKQINAYWRKHSTLRGFPDMRDDTAARIDATMQSQQEPGAPWVPDKHKVYPGYFFQNLGANIRRVRDRIKELESRPDPETASPTPAIEGPGYKITEHPEENRIWWEFDTKPDRPTCQLMRRYGWRWSPTRVVWLRHLNNAGRDAIAYTRRALEGKQSPGLTALGI